jgi:hypothetical protein
VVAVSLKNNGEIYEYITAGLSKGSHTFQFAASDGVDDATGDTGIHGGPGVDNTPPVLSNGQVSPDTGAVTTDFTYSVTYTDADNDPPLSITVAIDGATPQQMSVKPGEDGDYTNGEAYEYTTDGLVKDIAHTFQFAASDGADGATGDTDSHDGPTVENSLPSVAGVAITPDPAYTDSTLTSTPSGWSDADGDAEGYQWQWQKWDGASWQDIAGASTSTLDGSNFVKGDQIKVLSTPFDGTDTGTPFEDTITISNSPPIANAGPDQRALINSLITLDGSDSSDADGDPLTHLWSQTGGLTVTLSDPTAVNPTFTTPVAGTYTFSLVVNSGGDDSLPDTVVITVKASNMAPVLSEGTVNPTSGRISTTFTHSVVYTDADNEAPMSITISTDGDAPQDMSIKAGEDGDYTNGEIYEYTITGTDLGLGNHTFLFAASDGIANATGDTDIHDGPRVSSQPTGGGGGGGARPTITTVTLTGLTATVSLRVDAAGKVQATRQLTTLDGKATLDITEGTKLLDSQNKPLSSLSAESVALLPPPPAETGIVSAFDFEPQGATLSPPITLTVSYDPTALPPGVAEEDLYIAYWDGSKWIALESTVDAPAHKVSARVSHFTPFALMIKLAPPAFTITQLSITPEKVEPGEAVDVSIIVTNTGGTEGSHGVELGINGGIEAIQKIALLPGVSQPLSFTVMRKDPGTYKVTVGGMIGEFAVVKPVPPVPAAFHLSNLSISSTKVDPGQTVTITVRVANSGGTDGSYTVTLKIEGVAEHTDEVALAPGASQTVSFTVVRDVPGSYRVEVDNLSGRFIVEKIPGPNWGLIVSIIVAAVIVMGGLLLYFAWRKRRVTETSPGSQAE